MKAFDLHRMAFDKVPFDFLGEVALRSLYTFVLVFLFLKMTGRRGVRQMSLFEVLIILTLGSAAGDVAFYDDGRTAEGRNRRRNLPEVQSFRPPVPGAEHHIPRH